MHGLIGMNGLIPITSSIKKIENFLSQSESGSYTTLPMNQQLQVSHPSLIQPTHNTSFQSISNQIHQVKIELIRGILWLINEKYSIKSSPKDPSPTNNSSEPNSPHLTTLEKEPSEEKEPSLFQMSSSTKEKLEKFKKTAEANDEGDYDTHLTFLLRVDLLLAFILILYPNPILFLYHYFNYYSYKRFLVVFCNFQWDILLLECLFLSTFTSAYSYYGEREKTFLEVFIIWCYKLLFFRLMFGSGMVKGYGKDNSWKINDLTAMSYHFLTQPLPSWIGRLHYLHLSKAMFQILTGFTLISEIVFPLMSLYLPLLDAIIGGGRRGLAVITRIIFWGNVILQLAITFTGYFGFFNYLTIVLSFSLLSDYVIWTDWITTTFLSSTQITRFKEIFYVNSYAGKISRYLPIYLQYLHFIINYMIVFPILCLIVLTYFIALLKLLERTNWILPTLSSSEERKETDRSSESISSARNNISSKSMRIRYQIELLYNYLLLLHELFTHVFYVGHHYGLFANMTKIRYEVNVYVAVKSSSVSSQQKEKERKERHLTAAIEQKSSDKSDSDEKKIVIEDDEDELEWELIQWKFKPDNIYLGPKRVVPFFHMPRLDWCLWFLSFKPFFTMYPKWFYHLIIAILEHATPSNNKVTGQSIISLLHGETESLLGVIKDEVRSSQKEVVLKVTRSIYEFNRHHSQQHESPIWIKKQEKEILSPSNLMKLYDLYDRFCEGDRDEKGSEE
eukprot:gene12517-13701_t